MGTDREARALAAGDVLEVEGKDFRFRPVDIQRLCDLERDALKFYQRHTLQCYKDNLDLLEGVNTSKLMMDKLEEVSKWDMEDLPKKIAYDCSRVPMNRKMKKRIENEFETKPLTDTGYLSLLVMALDAKKITVKEVKDITGQSPARGFIRYDQWWVTASTQGMRLFVLNSVKQEHPEVTKEDVGSWPLPKIIEAARIVERLTAAKMGNG